MKKIIYLIFILTFVWSCEKENEHENEHENENENEHLLLYNLERPLALFIDDSTLYFTETSGRYTPSDGRLTLNSYDLTTNEKKVLKENPQNSEALVVINNEIYLSSWHNKSPGEYGKISKFNLLTNTEDHFMDIEIATKDMCMDESKNIYLLGSSDEADAKSLYKFPASNYSNPSVLLNGLGRTWCIAYSNGYIFYADRFNIYMFNESNNPSIFFHKGDVTGMDISDKYLYYSSYFDGIIGRINIDTKRDEILYDINNPTRIALDKQNSTLYVLTEGTVENEFKDGLLLKLSIVE